jgi:hypothetical protein
MRCILVPTSKSSLRRDIPVDHEAWKTSRKTVEERVKAPDDELAKRCAELGIPERFRPSIDWHWSGRGENGIADRRTELGRVAQTRIDERVKRAKVEIERRSVDLQTELAADGLETEQAKTFLASMPTIEELMPTLIFKELEDTANDHYRLLHRFD